MDERRMLPEQPHGESNAGFWLDPHTNPHIKTAGGPGRDVIGPHENDLHELIGPKVTVG